jgi:glutaredoxin
MPGLAVAQQQLFRYIDRDGRVVYTDTAPPSDARSVTQKKMGGNYIETSEPPYALQIAQQRNPVTLYAGSCGPLCDQSRALLNRRGVPYREIDPAQPGEGAKLKLVTGEMQVPVLVVGSTYVLKGLDEEKWQGALDQAGYPKTPAPRTTQLKREPVEKGIAGAPKSAAKGEARTVKAEPKSEPRAEAPSAAPSEARK